MPFGDDACFAGIDKETTTTIYLLRQIFRGKYGGSIETSVDLGAYSSKKQVDQAADEFMQTEVFHPDAPYILYVLPCATDTSPRALRESQGYYVSVETCLREMK